MHGVGWSALGRDLELGELGLGIVAAAVGGEVGDGGAGLGAVFVDGVLVELLDDLVGVDLEDVSFVDGASEGVMDERVSLGLPW